MFISQDWKPNVANTIVAPSLANKTVTSGAINPCGLNATVAVVAPLCPADEGNYTVIYIF